MSDRYLPKRFQPAPGIPVETYSKWMKSGCTFDTDGFVYNKKGEMLAEWYKLIDVTSVTAMPARLWSDLDTIEKILVDTEKTVFDHNEAVQVILAKYRKRLDEMTVSSALFCVPSYKTSGEKTWLTIHISYDGTGTRSYKSESALDFEVNPSTLHKPHVIGDDDIFDLVNLLDNHQIYMDRASYRSIFNECVLDSYLQKLQPKMNDVITVKTNHFSFVFMGTEKYRHGISNNPVSWTVMAGPLPNSSFLTMDISTGQIT